MCSSTLAYITPAAVQLALVLAPWPVEFVCNLLTRTVVPGNIDHPVLVALQSPLADGPHSVYDERRSGERTRMCKNDFVKRFPHVVPQLSNDFLKEEVDFAEKSPRKRENLGKRSG
jgi:hypothetical protein